jgi:diguanylate cyclase (GGDEF)-like protein/PAS domain S-box-containing protein
MKPDLQNSVSSRGFNARLFAISDALPLGILVSDIHGNCIYTNAAYHIISGQALVETLGSRWTNAIHPEDRQRVIAELSIAVRNHKPFRTEMRFVRPDNSLVWIRLNGASIRRTKKNKTSQGYVHIVEDISAFKALEMVVRAAEETFVEQQERAQVTLNSIGDAVLATDVAGDVSYLNRVAEVMTGWSAKDGVGQPLAQVFKVIDANTRQLLAKVVRDTIKENKITKLEHNCLLVRRDGLETPIEDSIAPIFNRDNEVTGAVIVFNDVGDARAMAQKMMDIAQHDSLTGLVNRMLLTERLTRAFGLAQRKNKKVGLLYIDVDNFKHINDSLGHAVGDELLQMVASRLLALVRATDTVCRQGGDEFVILLTEIEHYNYAGKVADKLISAFASPHIIQNHELHITLSIGISVFPTDCNNVETAYQHADLAMYQAKKLGKNNYQFYDENKTDMAQSKNHL